MSKLNVAQKRTPVYTHEGARASSISQEQALRRAVMSCMLWEDEFYESGVTIAKRIADLIPQCRPEFVAAVAYSARTDMKLRHVPLLIVREMARHEKHKGLVSGLLRDVVQRPDEITEFLAIYWRDGKEQPLSAQVKKGLAAAFQKFNEYALAKYDRDGPVKLRDAMFLSHPKPTVEQVTEERATTLTRQYKNGFGNVLRHVGSLFAKVAERQLATPDTWEVELSGGADKKDTFERLMEQGKLGDLAFLRNLRNMQQVGIERSVVKAYGDGLAYGRVLPFRFISAARAVPQWEDLLEPWMFKAIASMPKWPGRTALLIDGSGSMAEKVSEKSDISRRDAAIAVAMLLRELCEEVRIVGFSSQPWDIPPRRGFALREAVEARVIPESTYLGKAVRYVQADGHFDRIIVITDEQSADKPPKPQGTGYVINVASNQNGVGYGDWVHIDGWSEAVLGYIRQLETAEL